MPFVNVDPWQRALFAGVACDGVEIPVNDPGAWAAYPHHRWVYDRMAVCATQGLPCAPHGVDPPSWPVFSKPLVNLWGMGLGARVARDDAEIGYEPGHFWMPVLEGAHVSTEIALAEGRAAWFSHANGIAAGGGTFDRWEVGAAPPEGLQESLGAWCAEHLAGHTGIVNVETIGGRLIEVHLRMSGQFADLHGDGWLDAVVRLHRSGTWRFGGARRSGWSLPLFTAEDGVYHADHDQVARLRERVRSVQIVATEGAHLSLGANPAGGFLLAFVNAFDLEAAAAVRDELRAAFRRIAQ